MPYRESIDLLGPADGFNGTAMVYHIEVAYGWEVDPVSTRDLVLYLSADSVVTSFRIESWNKK